MERILSSIKYIAQHQDKQISTTDFLPLIPCLCCLKERDAKAFYALRLNMLLEKNVASAIFDFKQFFLRRFFYFRILYFRQMGFDHFAA